MWKKFDREHTVQNVHDFSSKWDLNYLKQISTFQCKLIGSFHTFFDKLQQSIKYLFLFFSDTKYALGRNVAPN